jgi:hypothetical protein
LNHPSTIFIRRHTSQPWLSTAAFIWQLGLYSWIIIYPARYISNTRVLIPLEPIDCFIRVYTFPFNTYDQAPIKITHPISELNRMGPSVEHKRYSAVLFDLDGLILDTERPSFIA